MTDPRIDERDQARFLEAVAYQELQVRALRIGLASALGQALLKGTAGLMTGSLALLATALDSLGDVLNVAVARIAVGLGARPPDSDHPFGHGKIEPLGALIQGAFILPVAAGLIWQSIVKLRGGGGVERPETAIAVILITLLIGWWTARHLRGVAGRTGSIVLRGSALTFGVDVATHLGVLISLVIIRVTGWAAADAVASMLVAVYITWQTLGLALRAGRDLLDAPLPAADLQVIEEELSEHRGEFLDYHRLRTRRAGPEKHIDFHITICRYRTLEESHRLVDHLENALEAIIPRSQVIIHTDPCQPGVTCAGEESCSLAPARRHLLPDSAWPHHPIGIDAREFERVEHPRQHPEVYPEEPIDDRGAR